MSFAKDEFSLFVQLFTTSPVLQPRFFFPVLADLTTFLFGIPSCFVCLLLHSFQRKFLCRNNIHAVSSFQGNTMESVVGFRVRVAVPFEEKIEFRNC